MHLFHFHQDYNMKLTALLQYQDRHPFESLLCHLLGPHFLWRVELVPPLAIWAEQRREHLCIRRKECSEHFEAEEGHRQQQSLYQPSKQPNQRVQFRYLERMVDKLGFRTEELIISRDLRLVFFLAQPGGQAACRPPQLPEHHHLSKIVDE